MNEFIIAAGASFLSGVLSGFHPCPVATNAAAVTMLAGWSMERDNRNLTLGSFVAGYLVAYLALSAILAWSALSVPAISRALQVLMNYMLGPLLILVGMLLADLLNLNRFYSGKILGSLRSYTWSGLSAFPFGVMIAMAFCPATAAIFFGILIPLAVEHEKEILFPFLYAAGAALPLVVISFLLASGIRLSGHPFIRKYLHRIAGWILIFIGIYLSVKRIYL